MTSPHPSPAGRPEPPGGSFRVLELFAGIGGAAAALEGSGAEVVCAVDVSPRALEVYRKSFRHPVSPRAVDSLKTAELAAWRADLWWLSPPCQPFTRRGLGRDHEDPRSRGLLSVVERISEAGPPALAVENVPGFQGSRCHRLLLAALDEAGYAFEEALLCPTELGIPNRRRRYYLVAGRGSVGALRISPRPLQPLSGYLSPPPEPDAPEPGEDRDLWVEDVLLDRYRHAVDLVDPEETGAVAACFTSAYGRSVVRSGSYLLTPRGVRRFSPEEILRLLGFPQEFAFPETFSRDLRWRLAGNSLSVPVVRSVLAAVPALAGRLSAPPCSPSATPPPAAPHRSSPPP